MNKLLTAALVSGAALLLPMAAAAPASASVPAPTCPAGTAAGPFTIYTGAGVNGAPGVVGVCDPALGYVEIGASGTSVYVVAQSNQFGYVGVSSYESQTHKCNAVVRQPGQPDPVEGGSGTNGGGCYGTNENFVDLRTGDVYVAGAKAATLPVAVPQAVPLPVCGDGTGPFTDSARDGCRVDNQDANDLLREITGLLP